MQLSSLQQNHQWAEHSISNQLSYKPCNDQNIYIKIELESTFVKITNPKKFNIIVGMIYRYPDFNKNDLNGLQD